MSEHLEMSGQSSLDKNFQIRTNNEGENELYIPCWEEEGSNSTQYHHLIEETKFFKNKCKHLQNHLEENHREFSSLNQLYLIAQTNERRLLKQTEDLRKANRELIGEFSQAKITIDTQTTQLHAAAKRESELREKFFKSREKQAELTSEIETLRAQCEMLRRKSAQIGLTTNAEEEKWKKWYNDKVGEIERQWKGAYEEIQSEYDKKSRQVRQRNEEIKSLTKGCNAHKEDYQLRIKGLEGDLQDLRRQFTKSKALASDYERQIKDLKLVRDEVSAKNDQIQAQNSRLKKMLKQQTSKYHKLEVQYQQLLSNLEEIKNKNLTLITEANNSKNSITELRLRISNLQKQVNEARAERDKIIIAKNYIENAHSSLEEEYAGYRRQKENQINNLKTFYEAKLKQIKQANYNEKSVLQTSIYTLKQEIESLKSEKREYSKLEASADRIIQLQEENATLKDQVLTWRGKFDRLNAKHRQEQLSLPKECHHQSEIGDLKQEIVSWKGKFDKLNLKYQQQLSLQKAPKQCHHEDEINSLKLEIRRTNEQKDQYKLNSVKTERLISDLNAELEKNRLKIDQLMQEKQKIAKQRKKLLEQKERLINDKSRMTEEIQALQNENSSLIAQRKQILSQEKSKNQTQNESLEKIRSLEQKLRQKSNDIEKMSKKMQTMQQQLQNYKMRPRQQSKDSQKVQRDRNKKYELKIKEKEKQIRQLQERLQQVQNQHEQQRAKFKSIEKQNRNKESQLNKKERKLKQLEKNIQELATQIQELERNTENDKKSIQTLKKQLKSQQNANEKLKLQIQRHSSQKQNWQTQQTSNAQYEKQRHDWNQRNKKLVNDVRTKDQQIIELKKQIQLIKQSTKSKQATKPQISNTNPQIEQYLRTKIQQLQQQAREKEQVIKRLQNMQKKDDDMPSGSLEELEAQYNRQLIALKRLIMYKGYKEDQNKKIDDLKAQYQNKIQLMLADYKSMYQQMIILKEKVINQRLIVTPPEPSIDIAAIEEVWRIKVQQISEEREVLIEKVAMWERKYEELRYLFEAKIESKQETINLLNLKLSNLEMSRPMCQYTCHHR